MNESLRILLGLTLTVSIALFSASRLFWPIRRHPLGAALLTGGWITVALGFLLGPYGFSIIEAEQILQLRSLIDFSMGWVGLMVGLQLQWSLIRHLPRSLIRLSCLDVLLSVIIFSAVFMLVLPKIGVAVHLVDAALIGLLISVCMMGWSPEVRSLQRSADISQRWAMVIRGGSGLCAIASVFIFGLLFKTGPIDFQRGATPLELLAGLGVSLVIAATTALMVTWLLRVAQRSQAQFLVVLIGSVAFMSGAAAALGYSPLWVSMLAGVILANVAEQSLSNFKQVIIKAEQPIAMVLMLVAGLLLEPFLPAEAWIIVGIVVVMRVMMKLMMRTWLLQSTWMAEHRSDPHDMAFGLLRFSPLSIVLATSYLLTGRGWAADAWITDQQLLMLILMLGVISDAGAWAARWIIGGMRHRSATQQDGRST